MTGKKYKIEGRKLEIYNVLVYRPHIDFLMQIMEPKTELKTAAQIRVIIKEFVEKQEGWEAFKKGLV